MSWWFLDSPVATSGGADRLVACLERVLPEALPRRYDLCEPPQFVYSETGRAHLIAFIERLRGQLGLVWYPSRPVLSVDLAYPGLVGPFWRGFRSNYISVAVDASALEQPGWPSQVRRSWIELSRLIRPFFGDARILHGYLHGRGTYAVNSQTQAHPVKSWWWRGVPTSLGIAVVCGEPYTRLWPAFDAVATRIEGLAMVISSDWPQEADLSQELGGVPSEIAQPALAPPDQQNIRAIINAEREALLERYPPIWPFEGPLGERKRSTGRSRP